MNCFNPEFFFPSFMVSAHVFFSSLLGSIQVIRGNHVHSLELIVKPFEVVGYGGGYVRVPA